MEIRIESLTDLPFAATQFLENMGDAKIFAFHAEMGTGKTTFITALLHAMGIKEVEGSPTYSLVNIYESEMFGSIYHFDLFRIESEEEALDIGVEEMIYSDSFCFIEWPDKIERLLPEGVVEVRMRKEGDVRILQLAISN
ncbi:MAG: tRNA (adenosine(37)-N6)-threonylcarbamoyltransferase complex ATPase subunit type 1 TsaE [Fluviicola sp.]|nr:tRNA (adenosine(37)-N6)-threonylcarbamoyltransferase complex ATPase subunit type 1 TsaE [Fluviicola sp.]